MNRDELLTKLAMELGEWPSKWTDECRKAIPEVDHWDLLGAKTFLAGSDGKRIEKTEWIQRRAELINKPPWDDAPEWARGRAQDADGRWQWLEHPDDAQPYRNEFWIASHKQGAACRGAVPAGHDWRETLDHRPTFNESRADIIGQNGNDGDHYETSTYCDRCGGEYWTPPHEYCPCVDGVGSGKQSRYQDHSGDDWIDEFARTATVEEFRGAMRFTIGKYNRRMGRKDEIAQEVRKMRDYCDRWLSYEEGQ